MRPIEIAYVLLNVPLLGWCLLNKTAPMWTRVVPAVTLIFLVVNVALAGARWSMAPAFVTTVWLFTAFTWPRSIEAGPWSGIAMAGMLVTAGALSTVLPVFDLPRPTGDYLVGTFTKHLVDSKHQQIQGDQPGGPRELMIQIWYPTQQAGPGQPYRKRDELSFLKQHLALVQTHAVPNVSVVATPARLPVLLFAPSWTGRRNQNTVQAEDLASHGFVVVGIDHPYSTALTVFPDGRKAESMLGEFLDCSSDEAVAACIRVANEQLALRMADARFVLDELERLDRLDPEGLFTRRLDFSRVGVFGHSFGGAVAAEVCKVDQRFKAGINYDGLVFGDVLEQGIGKPFLFFMDGTPVPTDADLGATKGPWLRELILVAENVERLRNAHADARGYWASVKGASHMSFCDSPLYSPIKRLTHAGSIDAHRVLDITNAYTLAFFDTYLNGKVTRLLDGPSAQYPEVEIEPLYTSERTSHYVSATNHLAKENP
jgi:dienelactone hydrolase